MSRAKRDVLAQFSAYTGLTGLLGLLPTKPVLLVLNYHRIGNADESPYDPGVFTATSDELDDHVRFLKRRLRIVTLDEAIAIAEGSERPRGTSVLITFDDGYLDNYETAFPILASHDVQGVFFLPTAFIGANRLPWWDSMAAIVKRSRRQTFRLGDSPGQQFDIIKEGVQRVIERVLWVYKLGALPNPEQFIVQLEEACETPRPNGDERCFLNWDEAAAMLRGGMALGAHTHSHEILSRLTEDQQLEEVVISRQIMEERLGVSVRAMSYPVGLPQSFSTATKEAAIKAGYRVAFSFYGGFNLRGSTDRFDIHRFAATAFPPRFRLQTTVGAVTGSYWF